MLMVKTEGTLRQIIESCDRVIEYLKTKTLIDLETDENLQDAVVFRLIVIGEAVGRLSNEFKTKYNKIKWNEIKGQRNFIVHQYDSIDNSDIFETVKNSVPELKSYCEQILRENL